MKLMSDGTLSVEVDDATKVKRVLVEDGKYGDLYYADRPTGSWKEDYNGGGFKEWLDITCSLCGNTLHDIQKLPEDYKFCPFCGARMKGADDDD